MRHENDVGGVLPKYQNVEEMEKLIDAYFKDCNGKMVYTENGEPFLNGKGEPVVMGTRPYTVAGLALALGFRSRQTLLNYQGKPEFMDTITRAKLRIEAYTNERLFDREGVNGAKFSLINNFKDYAEKQEHEHTGAQPVTIVNDLK